jgi:hypothetical protein
MARHTSVVIWSPRSEEEIQQAADNGLLVESHYLDLKREVTATDSGTKGIAKDIAAFAIDGGTILIGVNEETTPPSLYPIDLKGLAERIEQIGAMRVEEGVIVTTTVIESPPGSERGYLVVSVPASPRAPHMVDGRYYGRGDKTNVVLSHGEVLRMHERQLIEQEDILVRARAEMDSLVPGVSDRPFMVLIAEPLGARASLLRSLTSGGNWQGTTFEMVRESGVPEHQRFEPNFDGPQFSRRAGGVSVTTGMADGRRFGNGNAAEIMFKESGVLVLASCRPVVTIRRPRDDDDAERIFEALIVGHTERLVQLSGQVSTRYGFAGSWRFGLVVTGLSLDPWMVWCFDRRVNSENAF